MPNPFDEVLYPGFPFPESHPDRLATLATLFGMTPPRLESCRILELGCGDGSNLVPIAFGLPESHCVGIDLAARPIAKGQAMAEALGLTNIILRQMDILRVTPEFGEFDYIIAHGVYSWVPPEVGFKLLTICARNLSPTGVAYVSYNAYPGGHIREMLRRMMLYYARDTTDPEKFVSEGISLAKTLMDSMKEGDPRRQIIQPELERMARMSPASLFHDDLAEFNIPVYFYEFMERAEKEGLQFLAEADFTTMNVAQTIARSTGALASQDDVVNREQLLDFRIFRKFRHTLLCHKEIHLDGTPKLEPIRSLYMASPVQPASPNPDVRTTKTETFQAGEEKVKLSSNHPLTKAALLHLASHWPDRIPFERLKSSAVAISGWSPNGGPSLEEMLLKLYIGKIIHLHAHAPRLALKAGERPISSPVARYQLQERDLVTNLQHETVQVDNVIKHFISLMDGTRDRAALVKEMEKRIVSGELKVEKDGQPPEDVGEAKKLLADGMERNLEKLGRLALLFA